MLRALPGALAALMAPLMPPLLPPLLHPLMHPLMHAAQPTYLQAEMIMSGCHCLFARNIYTKVASVSR